MKNLKTILPFLLFACLTGNAQIGIGTTNPNGALDITSSTEGLLIPRVALANTTTVTVLTGTTSELVYNTATTGDVTPGFYYLSTATGPWIKLASGNSGWQTTGNTGIVDGTNYIGTATGTNINVAFRRNNIAAGKIGEFSTSFGVGALTNGANTNNSAFGNNALTTLTTGTNNVAVGQFALSASNGNYNTAIGWGALRDLASTAQWNTAIGNSALGRINNAGAQGNTAVGHEAMFAQTGAISNTTAIGYHALFQNSANDNTAVGYNALQGNLGAAGNTAVGSSTLNNNSIGTNNTAIGTQAGFAATSSNNTFVGYFAGQFSGGANNAVLGSNALRANGASANSVAVGYNALAANTASGNTAVGYNALSTNGTGTGNVAIGNNAGSLETTSNKLYISNSATNASTSLIYGEFSPTPILRTNGTLQIGDPAGTNGYALPIVRGTANQFLQTNGSGGTTWATIPVNTVKPYATTGTATGTYMVSLTEYTIRVFNDISEVRLPNAVGNTGKVYIIIGSNGISSKTLSTNGGGGIYDDVTNTTITTIATNQRIMVQSDGTGWIVIGR